MSEPAAPRTPLLPPRVLKLLAIAFAIGLGLFLLLWIDQRNDQEFFKASGTGAPSAEGDALPAPLPSDVANEDGGDNATGLRVPRDEPRPVAPAPEVLPRVVEPAPPWETAPPSIPEPQARPDMAENAPVAVSRPAPRYPREALNRNIGGIVRVQVVVGQDGRVERMELAESSGDRFLDRAAMEAVRRWRFIPATRNGQPVTASIIVPLEFNPGR